MTCRRVSREALEDNRETYVLAYVPTNSERDGKFRRIIVTINGDKAKSGNWTIRAKPGYWTDSAADRQ